MDSLGDKSIPHFHRIDPGMRLIFRFVLFFAAIFVLFSGLDVWTTELGRHRAGSVELNPMGFMPLSQSIRMEIPFLLLGCMLLVIGLWIQRDTLLLASSVPFEKFFWQFLLNRYFGFLLLFAPYRSRPAEELGGHQQRSATDYGMERGAAHEYLIERRLPQPVTDSPFFDVECRIPKDFLGILK